MEEREKPEQKRSLNTYSSSTLIRLALDSNITGISFTIG